LWKQVDGVRTHYIYSDEGLVGEYDAAGNELRTYGWAPHSRWGTDPLFVKLGSHYYWYQNDHQGTPQKIITTSGLVVWSAVYDSFGNAQIGVQGITNNLRFPGQYFDAETGLHYNLHRYYDPATGLYLRTDPYVQGLNLYAYCFNNPVTLIDPRGLCAVNALGHYLGTGFGAEATMWYADRFNDTGNPVYFIGGVFAALWTPETYVQTALTLTAAPYIAAEIAAAGAQSAIAAARVAAKEVVKEAIGVPVPVRPKGFSAAKELATGADEAVFWSGIRNGDVAAANWVAGNGGATLEITLAARGVRLPVWDVSNPVSIAAWRQASREFAAGASGNVRVLQLDAVRLKSFWAEVEFPALKANPNINSIKAINPETGAEVLLWSR
jgi:RHS repeat-associated protein